LTTVAGAILALTLRVSVRPALKAAGVGLAMVLKGSNRWRKQVRERHRRFDPGPPGTRPGTGEVLARDAESAEGPMRMGRGFCEPKTRDVQNAWISSPEGGGTQAAGSTHMTHSNLEPISGVFNYCDRWCERCPFTNRCSVHAVEIAMGMCGGDREAAVELAIGLPPPATPEEERRREELVETLNACTPTEAEMREFEREEEAREERVDDTRAITASTQVALLTDEWLKAHESIADALSSRAGDALAVAQWNQYLIPIKLRRALRGLDEHLHGESEWDDPVQNDWNGTAKLTLICIGRSIDAWDTLGEELTDADACAVADQLRGLQRELERLFPNASRFVRPGFDEEPGVSAGR
jgi:hypothetical protein